MERQKDLAEKLKEDFHGNELILDNSLEGIYPTLTESAKIFIREQTDIPVLIQVNSGGCHGLQYSFQNVNDGLGYAEICDDPPVYIDYESLHFMWGSRISVKELNGFNQLYIENPRAKQSCGCHSSFTYE